MSHNDLYNKNARKLRVRSITIYADNEEEYLTELDKEDAPRRSRLSQKEFDVTEEENEEDDPSSPRKGGFVQKNNMNRWFDNDDEDDYCGWGWGNFNDDPSDEEKLMEQFQNKASDNNYESGVDWLCWYLKNSISEGSSYTNKENNIFYKNKTCLHALSGNAIYDINIMDLVDNIVNNNTTGMCSDSNYYNCDDSSLNDNGLGVTNAKQTIKCSSNGLCDYLSQKVGKDEKIKIMAVSNCASWKHAIISRFINSTNVIKTGKSIISDNALPNVNSKINLQAQQDRWTGVEDNLEIKTSLSSSCENNRNSTQAQTQTQTQPPFEILNKEIRWFNKKIQIELFNTSETFHNQPVSSIYYKLSNTFFFIIDATCSNIILYLTSMLNKIEKYSSNKTLVLIGCNMLFKENCSINGENLKQFADDNNMLFIIGKINEFDISNQTIQNLLSWILIKKIDGSSVSSSRKSQARKSGSKNDNIKFDLNKIKINNCLGFKKEYRWKYINALDFESNEDFKNKKDILGKRRFSIDI